MSPKTVRLRTLPGDIASAHHRVQPNIWLTGLTMLLSDILALLLGSAIGLLVWAQINPGVLALYSSLWPSVVITVIVFACLNLYPAVGLNEVEQLRRITIGISCVYFGVTATIFLAKDFSSNSRGVFVTSWILSTILVPGTRALAAIWASKQPWWGTPVLILGGSPTTDVVISKLQSRPALGMTPVGYLSDTPIEIKSGVPMLGSLSDATEVAADRGIQYAIVAMPNLSRQDLLPLLEHLSTIFHDILLIPDLIGTASLWVSPRDLDGILGLQFRHNLLNPLNRITKRAIDIVGSLVGLILSAPIIGGAILWIKIVSPGKAMFVQERDGEGGTSVHVIKLRTMYLNAEEVLEEYLDSDPQARAEWEQYCKLKHDPRVLPGVGTLLRRTSLDELPQLWNVLVGNMSLVGPRPFPSYHNDRFDPDFRILRTRVKPGLTGLWQVSARSNGNLEVQAALDTYYIRNWSVWLDIYILIRTAKAVLYPSGAF